jgi:hypothetical protein
LKIHLIKRFHRAIVRISLNKTVLRTKSSIVYTQSCNNHVRKYGQKVHENTVQMCLAYFYWRKMCIYVTGMCSHQKFREENFEGNAWEKIKQGKVVLRSWNTYVSSAAVLNQVNVRLITSFSLEIMHALVASTHDMIRGSAVTLNSDWLITLVCFQHWSFCRYKKATKKNPGMLLWSMLTNLKKKKLHIREEFRTSTKLKNMMSMHETNA